MTDEEIAWAESDNGAGKLSWRQGQDLVEECRRLRKGVAKIAADAHERSDVLDSYGGNDYAHASGELDEIARDLDGLLTP